uniref:Uncharacterized protein n=1 Tax=Arundo donax TaxID=35708 RepID=A0A0A9BCB1_ARUDO
MMRVGSGSSRALI